MACTIMMPPINLYHTLTILFFKEPRKTTRNTLALQKFKGCTRLEKYNNKLVGQALLISRIYSQSKFYATVKSQWTISAEKK